MLFGVSNIKYYVEKTIRVPLLKELRNHLSTNDIDFPKRPTHAKTLTR